MQRPEVNGWQVTTNENGVKMATLPRDTMEALLKYAEYTEKQLRIGSVSNRFSDNKFITNVCLSYDHSFGLMTAEERKKVEFDCKEWMRAIKNNEPY